MRGSFWLLILFLAVSCTNKDSLPRGIIPKDKMEKILWDMIMADQYSTQYLVRDSARKNPKMETMKLYAEVFQIHHVSKEEFQKSFSYYLGRPDLTKIMFDSLSAQSNRHREELYYKQNINKPK
jgi:hypothetical protein